VEVFVVAEEIGVLSKTTSEHYNKNPAWRKNLKNTSGKLDATSVHTWMTTANLMNLGAIAVA
jgi:hypothetical protein